MKEAFLINPARRSRKRTSKIKRKIHRPVLYSTGSKLWSRSPKSRSRMAGITINPYRRKKRKNPIGEEVILVGANPKRKRRRTRKRSRSLYLMSNPKRKRSRVRRRRRSYMMSNPRKRYSKRRRSYMRSNPKRRSRRYRRNPAAALSGISIMRPMTLVMPLIVGLTAKMATERVPAMLNITAPLPRIGVQIALSVAGGMFLKKPLGATNAAIWTIMSGVTILTEVIQTYLPNLLGGGTTAGFSAIPMYGSPGVPYQGMSAYPEELSAYPYSGADVQY